MPLFYWYTRSVIKTVKCKLIVSNDQALALTETMVKFAAACNEIADYARRQKITHTFAIQALYYRYIRLAYGLSANHAIRVCNRVTNNKTGKTFRPTSVMIDDKLARYIEPSGEMSVLAAGGRIRMKLSIGEYQRSLLTGRNVTAGTISYDRRINQFFANICIELPDVPACGSNPLGVDLGINRIATTSTGLVLSGREVNRKREKFARVKASLQKRGTKGAKRVLKRLAGRERRYQSNTNHTISKRIVRLAKENDSFICLENLKGITARTMKHGKHHRRSMGRWAFYQLRQYIAYKAAESGVLVVFIDPRNTSKTCSVCGAIGIRKKHRFSCSSCGFVGDADVQAAINIAAKGAFANRPKVAICSER